MRLDQITRCLISASCLDQAWLSCGLALRKAVLKSASSQAVLWAQFRKLVRTIQNIALDLNRHYPARLHRLFLVGAPAIVHLPVRVCLPGQSPVRCSYRRWTGVLWWRLCSVSACKHVFTPALLQVSKLQGRLKPSEQLAWSTACDACAVGACAGHQDHAAPVDVPKDHHLRQRRPAPAARHRSGCCQR